MELWWSSVLLWSSNFFSLEMKFLLYLLLEVPHASHDVKFCPMVFVLVCFLCPSKALPEEQMSPEAQILGLMAARVRRRLGRVIYY